MNRDDLKKLFSAIRTFYPFKPDKTKTLMWEEELKFTSLAEAMEALKKYRASGESNFAPRPNHLRNAPKPEPQVGKFTIQDAQKRAETVEYAWIYRIRNFESGLMLCKIRREDGLVTSRYMRNPSPDFWVIGGYDEHQGKKYPYYIPLK